MRLQGKLVITVKVLTDEPEPKMLEPVRWGYILPDVLKYNGAACIVGDVRSDGTCWLNSVECK